jgi:hypothetical protein
MTGATWSRIHGPSRTKRLIEQNPNDCCDLRGPLGQLAVRETDDLIPAEAKLHVPGTIVLERLTPAVVPVAVGLDDE